MPDDNQPRCSTMGTVFCHLHPSEQAETTCSKCLKPVCSICAVYTRLGHFCPKCVRIVQRNRNMLKTGVTLLACGLFGLGVLYWLVLPGTRPEKGADGRVDPAPLLEDCDRGKIINQAEAKLRGGKPQQAIDLSDAFFHKCGKHLQLRWLTYTAYKQLSQWDKAISEVDRLITNDPYDKDYRWWRGFVFEQKGDLDQAVQDYRQALTLNPALSASHST